MAEEWGKIPRLVLDLEKQGSKVSTIKWLRKRPKFRGIPRLVLKKAEEKGKIPCLVLDLVYILPKVLSSTSSSLDDPSRTSDIKEMGMYTNGLFQANYYKIIPSQTKWKINIVFQNVLRFLAVSLGHRVDRKLKYKKLFCTECSSTCTIRKYTTGALLQLLRSTVLWILCLLLSQTGTLP